MSGHNIEMDVFKINVGLALAASASGLKFWITQCSDGCGGSDNGGVDGFGEGTVEQEPPAEIPHAPGPPPVSEGDPSWVSDMNRTGRPN